MRLTILLILFAFITQAQTGIDLINTKLKKPAVSYLYLGVTNVIKITGASKGVKYTLTSSANSKIATADSTNKFEVVAQNNNLFDTLRVIAGGKLVYSEVYSIKKIPDLEVHVGTITADNATVSTILMQPLLISSLPDCLFKISFPIVSFDFSTSTGTATISCTGNKFSSEVIDAIKKLKPGNKVYFDNIKLKAPEGNRTLPGGVVLTIR